MARRTGIIHLLDKLATEQRTPARGKGPLPSGPARDERYVRKLLAELSEKPPLNLPNIYRNLEFLEAVIECAAAKPPIKCFGNDFDPSNIRKGIIMGKEHHSPNWTLAAFTHVEESDWKILLARVNVLPGNNFASVEILRNAMNACVSTLRVLEGNEAIELREGNLNKVYRVADLLRTENAYILQQLEDARDQLKRVKK